MESLEKFVCTDEDYLFTRIYFRPELNYRQKKDLKLKLLDKYKGKLLYIYNNLGDRLTCTKISCKLTESIKFDQFKRAISKHYIDIRGCTVENICGQLSFYSQAKEINLQITFYPTLQYFDAKGDLKNLNKFLHGYRKTISEIDDNQLLDIPPDTLTMASLSSTEKLVSLSQIKPLDSEAQTDSTSTKQDSEETQRPETLILASDTQDLQDTIITDSPTTNVDKIQETPTTSIPNDTLQTVLQKLSSMEENISAIPKVLSSITAIEDRLTRMDSRMDLTETRLSTVERDMATIQTKHEKLDCNIFDLDNAVKDLKSDVDAIKTTHTHLKNHSNKLAAFETECNIKLQEMNKVISLLTVQKNSTAIGNPMDDIELTKLIEMKIAQAHRANHQSPKQATNATIAKYVFDHDNIIIGDSNLAKIQENRLHPSQTVGKFFAPTVVKAISQIKDAEIRKIPRKILIHLATNDIENDSCDTIMANFEELAKLLREKCPSSKIFVSSILARKEAEFTDKINHTNFQLEDMVDKHNKFVYMSNENIYDLRVHLGRDNKHLSPKGLHLLINNVKFALFSIPPTARPANNRYSNFKGPGRKKT